jgi:hypothetical protein
MRCPLFIHKECGCDIFIQEAKVCQIITCSSGVFSDVASMRSNRAIGVLTGYGHMKSRPSTMSFCLMTSPVMSRNQPALASYIVHCAQWDWYLVLTSRWLLKSKSKVMRCNWWLDSQNQSAILITVVMNQIRARQRETGGRRHIKMFWWNGGP